MKTKYEITIYREEEREPYPNGDKKTDRENIYHQLMDEIDLQAIIAAVNNPLPKQVINVREVWPPHTYPGAPIWQNPHHVTCDAYQMPLMKSGAEAKGAGGC